MFLMCLILFGVFTYAIEQAHLRMLEHNLYIREHLVVVEQLNLCEKSMEQVQSFCMDSLNTNNTELTVEQLLETQHANK